jgi:long-subunit acyl-CoA synthetase (AMP-forming)
VNGGARWRRVFAHVSRIVSTRQRRREIPHARLRMRYPPGGEGAWNLRSSPEDRMSAPRLLLDYVYDHESGWADRVYLTQPTGGGAVVAYTWGQVVDQARRMAAHLQGMGLQRGDKVALLTKNCAHFFMAELAIWIGGFTTVAIFPTESAENVRFVLDQSDARALFVGKLDAWPQQEVGVPAELPKIALPLAPPVSFERWDTITARTAPLPGRPARGADEVAILIYTSGSTGQPKGVMHTFGRMSAATEGIVRHVGYREDDRMLSYLPLAHVFERAYVLCATLVAGGHLFFAESLDTFVADLKRARPTLFVSVPRLWLKFQQGVFTKMPPGRLDLLLRIPLVGRLIARKVLAGLGLDHVRMAASGSAPIPAELIQWYRKLGLGLLEGYAMSEDFAYSHFSTLANNAPGYVGVPYPGVDVRISDEGEVMIRSIGQFVGYYKRPDLDAEAFTDDGFFRTGDKGERRADGMLKLTGRIKELFKTAKGKYVAPAPIENRLNEHAMIELSCVSGVGQPAAYALLVLAEDLRPKLSAAEVRARVEVELTAWLKRVNAELPGYEQLQMFVVLPGAWSIEAGSLTPTMKLKRARIEADVADRVDGWYAQGKPVVWAD